MPMLAGYWGEFTFNPQLQGQALVLYATVSWVHFGLGCCRNAHTEVCIIVHVVAVTACILEAMCLKKVGIRTIVYERDS